MRATGLCMLAAALLGSGAAFLQKLRPLRASALFAEVKIPPGFVTPQPQPLSVADGDYASVLSGALALAWRLGTGIFVVGWQPTPSSEGPWPGTLGKLRDGSSLMANVGRPKKLVVYEYEASPFCRKVREACSMLELQVEYRPCPGARQGWSDKQSLSTKGVRTVPYMEDGSVKMFESDDIIEYLFDNYGPGKRYIPWTLKGDFARVTATYAAAARGFAGSRLEPTARSDITSLKPITLYGYEGSPFVRPVREKLCALGLAHVMVNCPRGSRNRDILFAKTGRFQVPYIEDPNTGINMFESGAIVKYLMGAYTV